LENGKSRRIFKTRINIITMLVGKAFYMQIFNLFVSESFEIW